jgi:hypothetical protein
VVSDDAFCRDEKFEAEELLPPRNIVPNPAKNNDCIYFKLDF